jgi:NAD(P)H-flavin reductase
MNDARSGERGSLFLPKIATLVTTYPMTDRDRYFEFELDGRELGHLPGQFVEVSIPGIGEAPISISSSPTRDPRFELVVRNAGRVTAALHKLVPGEKTGIRGPFGTHFGLDGCKGKDLLFVAGGIGLAPLRSAINYAFDNRPDYGRIFILSGCIDPSQRLFTEELARWSREPAVTLLETVDRPDAAWHGNTGVITSLFPAIVESIDPTATRAFLVGPPVMYKFVILELKNLGFQDGDIVVSLERHMKCGVGKCGHCQIDGMLVCREGPVMRYESLIGHPEAL